MSVSAVAMSSSLSFETGDLVWFDPGVGYVLPGEVVEFHEAAKVVTVQAVINHVAKTFTLNNLGSVRLREDLGDRGVSDLLHLSDLNEASVLWNLRLRYDNSQIYTFVGSMLISVNPFRVIQPDPYNLDVVRQYDGQILGVLEPHIFGVASSAYQRMLSKNGENQVLIITGESGSGKTETCKLAIRFLAQVTHKSNNVADILTDVFPILEAFGHAKSARNNNASRLGRYLEMIYKDGAIEGAKVTDYLLDKWRIVSQASEERNFHVFHEMLAGLDPDNRAKLGLMSSEKYFYLNQGGSTVVDGKDDASDFVNLLSSLDSLSFSASEQQTLFKMLSAILHLGNVYFHRKPLKHSEGVEIGSDIEIKWTAHLLEINPTDITRALTTLTTDFGAETRTKTPLNIDQALDTRDAIAKTLYQALVAFVLARVNKSIGRRSNRAKRGLGKNILGVLDLFGFENLEDNSFEQLCINFAAASLHHHLVRHVFKLEQAEYGRERLEWAPISFASIDNQSSLHMLSKKPLGIFHLLDDEANFPRGTDLSFLEKCHYNHALNELYSRPRMNSAEFGIKHFAGTVFYNVDSFLDKNRDTLRYDVLELLLSTRSKLVSRMLRDFCLIQLEALKTLDNSVGNNNNKGGRGPLKANLARATDFLGINVENDNHLLSMKPRAPTVAARFQDSLSILLQTLSECHPFYVRCLRPNGEQTPMKFDMPMVLEQIRYQGLLETVRIRKSGFPVRMKYRDFSRRYRCTLPSHLLESKRSLSTKEVTRLILDRVQDSHQRELFALGSTKIFVKEELETHLERQRQSVLDKEIVKVQRFARGYLARKHYRNMRESATRIQAHYRGFRVRRDYHKLRVGVVAMQAVVRMRRQRALYVDMKEQLMAQKIALHEARRRLDVKKRNRRHLAKDDFDEESGQRGAKERSKVKRSVGMEMSQLEVPPDLALLWSACDERSKRGVGADSLAKISGNSHIAVSKKDSKPRLPVDVDTHHFSKMSNVYFKHPWHMREEPIKSPFLAKTMPTAKGAAVASFKLIMRFMNDQELNAQKEKILADYIVNMGLREETLRDEILCQIANQVWNNDDEISVERGWLLMAHCLSAFAPSRELHTYFLKLASDHAYNGYKSVCQRKLIKSGELETTECRRFPPTLLEYRANKKRAQLALEAQCSDGFTRHAALTSFTTAEEFVATLLAEGRNVTDDTQGWTLALDEEKERLEMNGDNFVLDAISFKERDKDEDELVFLIARDESRGQLPLLITMGPHNNPQLSTKHRLRAWSQERLALREQQRFGLSQGSALNERYFGQDAESRTGESVNRESSRSRSLDNLLNESGGRLMRRYQDMSSGLNDSAQFSPEDLEMERIDRQATETMRSSQPDLVNTNAMTQMENRPKSQGPEGPRRPLHGPPRYVKGGRNLPPLKSSAMSDTSEGAGSIASHVRGVRVPSQASDVDQFLDDLFMPVISQQGHNTDGLSDARSLAASTIKGALNTRKSVLNNAPAQVSPVNWTPLTSVTSLMAALKGTHGVQGSQPNAGQPPPPPPPPMPPSRQGFQPIYSTNSLASPPPIVMSPPPMLMPTPTGGVANSSHNSSMMMDGPMSTQQPAMAFTYVPVPVYNMTGFSFPHNTSFGVPAAPTMGSATPSAGATANPRAASAASQAPNGALDVTSSLQQQAFLQSAVSQNMQIQQQLMMQNQALTQLMQQQNQNLSGHFVVHNSEEQAKFINRPRSSSTPTMKEEDVLQQHLMVDKWNWPTSNHDLNAMSKEDREDFMEFRMRRKLQRRQEREEKEQENEYEQAHGQEEHDDHDEQQINKSGRSRTRGHREDNFDEDFDESLRRRVPRATHNADDSFDAPDYERTSSPDEPHDHKTSSAIGATNQSHSKLQLSNEMRHRLESAVTKSSRKHYEELNDVSDQQEPSSKKDLRKTTSRSSPNSSSSIPTAPRLRDEQRGGRRLPPPPHLQSHLLQGQSKNVKNNQEEKADANDDSFYSPEGSLPDPFNAGGDSEAMEESDFLEPVVASKSKESKLKRRGKGELEDNYHMLEEEMRTRLHPVFNQSHFAYNRVPWTLKVRKEFFSPTESLSSALAIDLVFYQIVQDVFSPLCLRLNAEERSRMKTLLDEYEIELSNVFAGQHKTSTKQNIIAMAKEMDVYFARLYPLTLVRDSSAVNESDEGMGGERYLAVNHSGIKLVRRKSSRPTDYFEVLDSWQYEDVGEVSLIMGDSEDMATADLRIVTHHGQKIDLGTDQAHQIRDVLQKHVAESNSSQFDYARALADFRSRDESTISFVKNDVIAIIPRHDAYTEKGWLYGMKDGQLGLFPSDFVQRMSPQTIQREMRVIARAITQRKGNNNNNSNDDEDDDSALTSSDEERDEHHGRRDAKKRERQSSNLTDDQMSEVSESAKKVSVDGKHPLLEFALTHFRNHDQLRISPEKSNKSRRGSSAEKDSWTWKHSVDLVKWSPSMIEHSLLHLEPAAVNRIGLECFACVLRYMGELALLEKQHEVDCVHTLLMYCHKFESIRDEVYCQLMKQTTNNKSDVRDSCQKAWRLFSIVAAYFTCSALLEPYLFKFLQNAAYDKRRAYHGTALVTLHNLRKTFKYGGRKNVPSVEEVTAISAGRNSKRQIYRLPGGTERVINTKSTSVVENIIDELCTVIGVPPNTNERDEFSLYCIVDGETFTVPLAKEHYILDVTTELQRDGATFYLIFCRSVWHYPLRLENSLYTEVVFNQVAPDYLEGLLLVMPEEKIPDDLINDIASVAAMLHRAADMENKPSIKETKFLLPKPALADRNVKPPQWVNMVHNCWEQQASKMSVNKAKAAVLDILATWPLFGSSFFAVRRLKETGKMKGGESNEVDSFSSPTVDSNEHILALNKSGVSFLHVSTHECALHFPFTEVISTRKVQADGALFLDMKCGNLMQQSITRIQTEQANEIARLIKQYITIDLRLKADNKGERNNQQ